MLLIFHKFPYLPLSWVSPSQSEYCIALNVYTSVSTQYSVYTLLPERSDGISCKYSLLVYIYIQRRTQKLTTGWVMESQKPSWQASHLPLMMPAPPIRVHASVRVMLLSKIRLPVDRLGDINRDSVGKEASGRLIIITTALETFRCSARRQRAHGAARSAVRLG